MGFVYLIAFIIGLVVFIFAMSVNDGKRMDTISNSRETTRLYMNEIGFTNDADFVFNSTHIYVDNHNNKLMILDEMANKRVVVDFKSILGTEYQENGVHTDGVGRAVIGGALFGETGAIVGAVTGKKAIQSAKIILFLNDVAEPNYTFYLHQGSDMNCNTPFYESMMDFKNRFDATVRAIIAKNELSGSSVSSGEQKIIVHDSNDVISLRVSKEESNLTKADIIKEISNAESYNSIKDILSKAMTSRRNGLFGRPSQGELNDVYFEVSKAAINPEDNPIELVKEKLIKLFSD